MKVSGQQRFIRRSLNAIEIRVVTVRKSAPEMNCTPSNERRLWKWFTKWAPRQSYRRMFLAATIIFDILILRIQFTNPQPEDAGDDQFPEEQFSTIFYFQLWILASWLYFKTAVVEVWYNSSTDCRYWTIVTYSSRYELHTEFLHRTQVFSFSNLLIV